MAKSQKKSGRESRKAKKDDTKPKSKQPRYLAEDAPTHIQIPTGKTAEKR